MKIPRLTYYLSNPSSKDYGWILANDERIFRVTDAYEFYRALGYTDEMGRSGVMPDEFIWMTYTKDNCERSANCVQVKIINYLSSKSDSLKKAFRNQLEHWEGECQFSDSKGNEDCATCLMHPKKKKEKKENKHSLPEHDVTQTPAQARHEKLKRKS